MNLQLEYARRKRIDSGWGTLDSMVFFNDHDRPAAICLSSTHPRSISTCEECGRCSLIFEICVPNRDSIYSIKNHAHVGPDHNLIKHVKQKLSKPLTVYYPKNQQDIDMRIWEFFIFHNRNRYVDDWAQMLESTSKHPQALRGAEQMAWCAINHPRIYNNYYNAYSNLIGGRNYLLI